MKPGRKQPMSAAAAMASGPVAPYMKAKLLSAALPSRH
jgi:hypothetical protein